MRAWPAVVALGLLLGAALLAPPAAGQPEGRFAISPGRLELPDAQPGETYLRRVQVQNGYDTPSTITITAWGSGTWATADPASGFTIPAHGARDVTLAVAVPAGQGPGAAPGWVNFTTEEKPGPSGGASVRLGAALALDVTVGGAAVQRLVWLSADVPDAVVGQPVHASLRARNEGNVRALAEASGAVLPFAADAPELANATGSRLLLPGEEADVALEFPAGLAVGQYRARLRGGTLDEVLAFKVLGPGEVAPDGELRALRAEGELRAGRPVTLVAVFANTGGLDVASAAFRGEVLRGGPDGRPVEALASLASPAPAGEETDLHLEWTPEAAGTYVLRGTVTYDGYETLPNEVLLTVEPAGRGAAGGGWLWWLLLLVIAVALLVILWAWRRGRQDERDDAKGKGR